MRRAVPTIQNHHVPALDGVRGLAVLLVMVLHYELRRGPWHASPWVLLRPVVSAGWSGVDLFFVLSGFLITGILWSTREEAHYFRNFYARRTLRIVPLYFVTLAALFLILPVLLVRTSLVPPTTFGVQAWFWAFGCNILLALHGWGAMPLYTDHFWSLAIEEQFYLVWPAALRRLTRTGALALCGAAIGTALLVRTWLVLSRGDVTAALALTPARMDCLAVGAIIALVARGPDGLSGLTRYAGRLLGAGGAALALLLLWRRTVSNTDVGMATVGYTVVAFFWGSVLVSALAGGRVSRAFSGAMIRWIGRRSYALYVLHYPILLAFDRAGWTVAALERGVGSALGGHLIFLGANVALTMGSAELSWRLLESPMLRLKRRFSPERRPRAPEMDEPSGPSRPTDSRLRRPPEPPDRPHPRRAARSGRERRQRPRS
jgi:peptidoglycan/LPS O-acetylase OafA/YrhL